MSQVQSVRYGFATNSSSTHSIIITKDKSRAKDKLSDYFGWDFFTPEEGKFSCYIDGVAEKIGPSSYSPDDMTAFPYDSFNQFLQKFTTF